MSFTQTSIKDTNKINFTINPIIKISTLHNHHLSHRLLQIIVTNQNTG